MATGQAAFASIGDGFGTTFARWQSYWIDAITSWDGQSWAYQQLDWAGVTSGQAMGEQATLTLPAVPSVLDMTDPVPTFHTAECLAAMGQLDDARDALDMVVKHCRTEKHDALKARAQAMLEIVQNAVQTQSAAGESADTGSAAGA
jgi:hypothetical protein